MSPEQHLRSRGLRVTRPRITVLEILAEGGHLEVEEIAKRVRERLDSVSTQAVYDVLGALARVGLARRIEPAGSSALYERRVGDNHHHVVCRGCGAIADVDCVVGDAPCLEPSAADGFVVDEAEVTFWGLCPLCQRGGETSGPNGDGSDARSDPIRTGTELSGPAGAESFVTGRTAY